MNGYVKDFNHKSVNLLVHNKELLKKYNEIWDKISNLLKKGFDSKPVYNDKYIKTKIKIYIHRINTNLQGNKIPEDNKHCTCLFVLLLDSVIEIDSDYYPQIFVRECKFSVKINHNKYN